jgi:hypothetical protein
LTYGFIIFYSLLGLFLLNLTWSLLLLLPFRLLIWLIFCLVFRFRITFLVDLFSLVSLLSLIILFILALHLPIFKWSIFLLFFLSNCFSDYRILYFKTFLSIDNSLDFLFIGYILFHLEIIITFAINFTILCSKLAELFFISFPILWSSIQIDLLFRLAELLPLLGNQFG